MPFPNPLRAIITGGGSGLGRELALNLAHQGASLVVSDVNNEGAEETATQARALGAKAEVVGCDVADRDAVFAMVDEAEALLGGVDLICNNAGVSVGGPFEDIHIEDWRWIMDINLWGVIYGCQAVAPKMRAQGHGYILNTASAAGLLCPPNMSAYNVTKAGVVSLSETLYAEYKTCGINVSVLCPTFFVTNIIEGGRGPSSPEDEAQLRKWMERSPVQAPDVAAAALDAVRDGELYVQPMSDGRNAWRLKRLAPQRFYDRLSSDHDRHIASRKQS